MIYLSAHESNHGVPSPFRKLDPKAQELHLIDRNQVSQRSKADIRLLWLIHMQFQETERIPAGYFLLHLPQCLMQSKSLPDATGTLIQTSRRREILGWLGIRSIPMHPLAQTHVASCDLSFDLRTIRN
jgi:hypothetical protein